MRGGQRPRASLHPSVPKLRQQLVGAVGVADQFGRNMGVLRRRAKLGVTEQHLDHAYIRPSLKQMRCKTVAERVATAVFGDVCSAHRLFHSPLECPFKNVMAADDAGARIDGALGSGDDILPSPFPRCIGIFTG